MYFEHFPLTPHTGRLLSDITRRVSVHDTVLGDPYNYLPYTIPDNKKPEDIARLYYGNVNYTWLVFISAKIIDPYYDWPMNSENFEKYIMKKYKEQSGTTGLPVIHWTMNETIDENIVGYRTPDGDLVSRDTFANTPITTGWLPYRIYQYELDENEKKRSIRLLNRDLARKADQQFRKLINESIT